MDFLWPNCFAAGSSEFAESVAAEMLASAGNSAAPEQVEQVEQVELAECFALVKQADRHNKQNLAHFGKDYSTVEALVADFAHPPHKDFDYNLVDSYYL